MAKYSFFFFFLNILNGGIFDAFSLRLIVGCDRISAIISSGRMCTITATFSNSSGSPYVCWKKKKFSLRVKVANVWKYYHLKP